MVSLTILAILRKFRDIVLRKIQLRTKCVRRRNRTFSMSAQLFIQELEHEAQSKTLKKLHLIRGPQYNRYDQFIIMFSKADKCCHKILFSTYFTFSCSIVQINKKKTQKLSARPRCFW